MRRYDLDWLRVIVFGLLIFYHVGMFFVPWGFHIKNNIIYPDIRWPMLFVNQWRLPILFVISGMGTYYALSKRNVWQFSGERIKRLLLPLLVGMSLIVPPQVYFERIANGQFSGSYFDFWPAFAFDGVYPEGNISWHHLWFLPYLLIFSLVLLPLFVYLRRHPTSPLLKTMNTLAKKPFGLFCLIIPLYLWESLLEPFFPSTHALWGDWFNVVNYLTLFLFGFLLISVKDSFWNTVLENRRKYLYAGAVGFTLLIGLRILFEDSTLIHFIEAGFKVFNLWAWILALFGYAAAYLNKPSKVLSYANESVYPFYILHQTITIAIGFYLMDLTWGFWSKFILMSVGTFAGSWLIYELGIRRWRLIRPLFGLKPKAARQTLQSGNLAP
ncbi:Glucans biosynthesis protein C [Indibacter alkaliphilus LW1]|uniref:Glucans biosynthesis protein C n=1 Tax=Indibacter alkaliphilus (strain CCUG 57479 / KCTC 22604 / LW1) TaxID=1189612 RepID=S2DJX7_INDAL|nr:acyltransferase family protein [Indibacter alkaliphilus]EOZ92301.1 Glucans biosynthesis protein C [Indibacter alkaliphilus LW1]